MLPDYLLKALFVTVGLLLIRQAYELTDDVRKWGSKGLLHAIAGVAALFTANMAGSLLGLGVGLNGLTLPVSAALGTPGVALLWAVKYLL